jgi:hypothetical protein
LHEVNARSIPDIKDFTALPGSLSERVDGLSLETAHVVLLFAREKAAMKKLQKAAKKLPGMNGTRLRVVFVFELPSSNTFC